MKKAAYATFILVVMILPIGSAVIPDSFFDSLLFSRDYSAPSYTSHPTIIILSNNDFETQGWPGEGTSNNPYTISGFNITSDQICIAIYDTTAFFTIESCFLGHGTNTGIRLDNVTNGLVKDVYIADKQTGIDIYDSIDCKITNISIVSDYDKMNVYNSENTIVENCLFEGIHGSGLYIELDTGSVFENNNFSRADITIKDSMNSNISNNVLFHEEIEIQNSDSITLTNNSITDCVNPAININTESDGCIIQDNIIEDIFDYGILLDSVSNIVVRNNTVSTSDENLYHVYKCNNCIIEDNHAEISERYGYFVDSSNDILILNNTAEWCYWGAFFVSYSDFVNYTQNEVDRETTPNSSAAGIKVYYCTHTTMLQNHLKGYYYGVFETYSNYSIIYGNIISDNEYQGILVSNSLHTVVSFNEAYDNDRSGIKLTESEDCTMNSNILYDNSGFQIYVSYSINIYISKNNASHTQGSGFELYQTLNSTLFDNVAHNLSGTGYYLHDLQNITMIENKAYEIYSAGLHLRSIEESFVVEMTATDCYYYGIRIESSADIELIDCLCSNNGDDVYLQNSENCTLTGCKLGNRGLRVSGSTPAEYEHNVISTTVIDGPVIYLYDEFMMICDATSYGQLFIVNGSIIVVNNGVFSNHTSGVVVVYSQSVILNDVNVYDCSNGFEILHSESVTIDHCTSYRNGLSGFKIENTPSTSILSCTAYTQLSGFDVDTSPDLIIDHCVSYDNNGDGFYIFEAEFATISNCSSYDNFNAGICLILSNNCSVEENEVTHSGYGIRLIMCINGSLSGNTIDLNGGSTGIDIRESTYFDIFSNEISNANYAGIKLEESSNIHILNNQMQYCGLFIDDTNLAYWNHDISSTNDVNGKPLGIFTNVSNLNINAEDYGQLWLDNCSDIVISGCFFENVSIPLILNRCDNITASAFSTTGGSYGTLIFYSTNCTLQNSNIDFPNLSGIYTYLATHSTFDNVSINGTNHGFNFRDSDNSIITHCVISNATEAGFYLRNSDDCLLHSNLVYYCDIGFEISYSLRNNFTENSVLYNNVGFYTTSLSDNNLFLLNEIGWNSLYNAYDNVFGNHWDNGIDTGNAWSDYVSGGFYEVDGIVGAIDGFPTTLQTLTPEINGPDDFIYWRTISTDVLQWNASSQYPSHYRILLNSSFLTTQPWDGYSPIIIHLNTYSVGTYNFILQVYSIGSSFDSDFVTVTILDTTTPIIDEPPNVEYTFSETGNSITWYPMDSYPSSYQIYQNSILIDDGIWDGSQISINVDGLSVGTWIYEIVVYSMTMSANDTVLVTVNSITTSTTTTTTTTTSTSTTTTTSEGNTTTSTVDGFDATMIIVAGGIGGTAIVIILLIILKKRNPVES
ncbi:MAG: right-handed parallel beta-helix repeat-containing protein [Candidatus Thorarchaeota archaeon]